MENIKAKTPDNLKVVKTKIDALKKKISATPITNTASYNDVLNLTLQKWELEKECGYVGNYKLLERMHKLLGSDNLKNYKKKSAEELLSIVANVEDMRDHEEFPLSSVQMRSLWNLKKKEEIMKLHLEYVTKVLAVGQKDKEQIIEKAKITTDKKVKEIKTYCKDLVQVTANKYHAKLVLFLENKKKKDPVISKNNNIIELKGVSKYYANNSIAFHVLKHIDLTIKKGEFVVILGPSGSGKTTLLNIISGMDNATYGDVVVAKESLINKRGSALTIFRKDNVGYVFQQYGLLPNLTVRENVEIGWSLQDDKAKRLPIDELLQTIGMYEYKNKFPYELSGGQQQRVSIARSLAKNPNLLFGDEPTGAVDEKTSKEILQLFKEVNGKYKNTVIIVTHNPLIAKLATTIIKVNNGKIEKIINNPKPMSVEQVDWSIG